MYSFEWRFGCSEAGQTVLSLRHPGSPFFFCEPRESHEIPVIPAENGRAFSDINTVHGSRKLALGLPVVLR